MNRSVVAGVDGSAEGFDAADWAAREALRRGLPLRLVHARKPGPPRGTPDADLSEPTAPEQHARLLLHHALDRLDERYPQLTITAEQVAGDPVAALLAQAADADLLVIGSQGRSGLGGFVSGAVAPAVAARSRRPVVLVRAGRTAEADHLPDAHAGPSLHTPFRDVAVAVDVAEPSADDVLDFAFRAAEFRHAPLRALHAWHVPVTHALPDAEQRGRMRAAAQRELAGRLDPWRRKYPTVVVREALHEGRPAHALVRAAGGAGLLVIGTRRRGRPVGGHTGPVAHALIHHVRCPVALVPHE
ncbi:universal stress protein [Streptomyces actuosus]|uniref:Universal stress protein n=1 Tax=Streptomyces actuosus TaxID=1885 RepID=A0ABS2VI08_STRAS|nr:universal stress protein [Streptomyces actuosus]MBN0042728.1 universal stress protein [Streptomyces actuosus]